MQTAVQQNQTGNLALYNQVRSVPENAKSPISGGPMKGKTNVNPMWRIQKLTELFGPCGEGFVRCSYATAMDEIEEAIRRIGEFVAKR